MKNNISDRQDGVVLIISLIMLMVLTLIGLSSARISGLEVLMGTNTQNSVTSFMSAEDSAFAGEQRVLADFNGPPNIDLAANANDGLYLDAEVVVDTVDWSNLNFEVEPRVNESPREFIVEYIGPRTVPSGSQGVGVGAVGNMRYIYRINGHGGSNRGSARVVQTIFSTQGF